MDFIGDIHGHRERLEFLLQKMGYSLVGGSYRHPCRQAVFDHHRSRSKFNHQTFLAHIVERRSLVACPDARKTLRVPRSRHKLAVSLLHIVAVVGKVLPVGEIDHIGTRIIVGDARTVIADLHKVAVGSLEELLHIFHDFGSAVFSSLSTFI